MSNCILASVIAIREVWIPYMDAGSDAYMKIQSEPFDGTVMPISYIPDWSKTANQDKTKRFEDIAISDYIPVPTYNPQSLLDINNFSKSSLILHYTYITPFMGSYRLNYKEHDGSHVGVDIRAPIWTPVLAIANGVVIKTVEADATGNKFVVVRHDGVPSYGTLYSGYLHLSQIHVTEWTKIRKWEMLGRVGMTGIATTPHLHIQIDVKEAPFFPYWPFTSSDSRMAGLGFFESVNSWLGKENALKYSVHPMDFINKYIGWTAGVPVNTQPTPILAGSVDEEQEQRAREILLGSYTSEPTPQCSKKRFSDVTESSSLWKMLYPLVDSLCMFQKDGNFLPKENVSQEEAITSLMKFYGIVPEAWTSNFLDITIWDPFHGYALAAEKLGILTGNYAQWEKILTREEFVALIAKIGKLKKNPSGIKVYADVDSMNVNFMSIQDYAYTISARGGRFYPKTILTKAMMVQILAWLQKVKK